MEPGEGAGDGATTGFRDARSGQAVYGRRWDLGARDWGFPLGTLGSFWGPGTCPFFGDLNGEKPGYARIL